MENKALWVPIGLVMLFVDQKIDASEIVTTHALGTQRTRPWPPRGVEPYCACQKQETQQEPGRMNAQSRMGWACPSLTRSRRSLPGLK